MFEITMDAILYLSFAIIINIIILSNILIVQEKTALIVERLGKFNSVKRSGFNYTIPIIDKVVGKVNLQLMELESNVTVKSKDNAFLIVPIKIQYKVLDSKIKESFYELETPTEQMGSYVFNIIRAKSSTLTMDELFLSKDEFEKTVKTELNEKFDDFGFFIMNVLVDDPQPSAELIKFFDNVLATEKQKEAAKNEAESLKIKLLGEAIAEKESLKLKGEAFKEYRMAIAEGNVEAMGMLIGTHKLIEKKKVRKEKTEIGEEVEVEYIEKEIVKLKDEDIVNTGLTSKDILDFFAGVDEREAIRDAAKGEGNTVVFTSGSSSTKNLEEILGLIKGLKN